MTTYEELKRRGLIAQVTDEKLIQEMIDSGKATFYIGFDCTADSLTAGHFMALTLMKRLQMAGNKPIALIGGGTTMIGDPSGRTDMRKMLTREDIDHNAECLKESGMTEQPSTAQHTTELTLNHICKKSLTPLCSLLKVSSSSFSIWPLLLLWSLILDF